MWLFHQFYRGKNIHMNLLPRNKKKFLYLRYKSQHISIDRMFLHKQLQLSLIIYKDSNILSISFLLTPCGYHILLLELFIVITAGSLLSKTEELSCFDRGVKSNTFNQIITCQCFDLASQGIVLSVSRDLLW